MGRGITDRIPMPNMLGAAYQQLKEEQEMCPCNECKCRREEKQEHTRFNHFLLFSRDGVILKSAKTTLGKTAKQWFADLPEATKAKAHTLVNVYESPAGTDDPLRTQRHKVVGGAYRLERVV